jgi:hypothetical protein
MRKYMIAKMTTNGANWTSVSVDNGDAPLTWAKADVMNKGGSSGERRKGGVGESASYIAGAAWKATLFAETDGRFRDVVSCARPLARLSAVGPAHANPTRRTRACGCSRRPENESALTIAAKSSFWAMVSRPGPIFGPTENR